MPEDPERITEHTHLLPSSAHEGRLEALRRDSREHDAQSILSSHLSKEELALGSTALGERLPYNDYTTIDWLHDLVRQPLLLQSIWADPAQGQRLISSAIATFETGSTIPPTISLGRLSRMGSSCHHGYSDRWRRIPRGYRRGNRQRLEDRILYQ